MGDQSRVFVRKLLMWYKKAARTLPWRHTRNPYAILVSEFMLQQTQVSRVLDYFPRFMARFPTIDALARSRPKAVMEQWDGLGYYAEQETCTSWRGKSHVSMTARCPTVLRHYRHSPVSGGTRRGPSRAAHVTRRYRRW